MVHDPRVSACLARLGGVYRDPPRVDRDASSLLKSSVGSNLIPIVAEMFENNGNRANVLVLQGTIAIHFRGQTYQILVDQYLSSGYPNRPPVPYVRLAPNMYLKENHRHVGSDGKVYLPYLHEWRADTHNLVELVVAMSSVFSADPPVFTRRPGQAGSSSNSNATGYGSNTRPASDAAAAAGGAMMTDEEAIAAVQAAEAREKAEAERKRREEEQEAERRRIEEERLLEEQERRRIEEERETQRAVDAQREWERKRTEQVRVQVTAKIRQHLSEQSRQAQQTISTDLARDLTRLELAKEQKIDAPIEALEKQKAYLEQQLVVAEESKMDMEAWIEQAQASKANAQIGGTALTVDDKVVPERPLHAQMMELSAENAAITDALYFLDRAMHQGHLSCEVHLKQVRRLAKRQFLVRAHLIKINQVLLAA